MTRWPPPGCEASTRAKTGDLDEQLTLDQYAILAEFDDDPDAVDRLAGRGRLGRVAGARGRTAPPAARRASRARAPARRAGRGRVRGHGDYSPAPHQLLTGLSHDGEDLTPETHAACPGRGVFFRPWDLTSPVHYCADPATYGHTFRSATTASAAAPGQPDAPDPAGPPADDTRIRPGGSSSRATRPGPPPPRSAGDGWPTLFARRTAPREVAQFVARQLLAMPEPLRSGLARAHAQVLFASSPDATTATGSRPATPHRRGGCRW